ncbi:MAG: hypothetical protein SOY99_01210 [Alloprevotella sp.]|nr:hypothetical protein [Alloprevotella sp.]
MPKNSFSSGATKMYAHRLLPFFQALALHHAPQAEKQPIAIR